MNTMTRHHCKTADGADFYFNTADRARRFVDREGGEYLGEVNARPVLDSMFAEMAEKVRAEQE